MNLTALKKSLGIQRIVGLDFETYYDSVHYTLKKLATTEYITDPRFKMHMVAVMMDTWSKPRIMNEAQFRKWSATVDWSTTGVLAHHTQFDGLILTHHIRVRAKFYFDTMSMARPLAKVHIGGSLERLALAFGLEGKKGAEVLVNTNGKQVLTKDEYKAMATYAGQDIIIAWQLFEKLLPYTTLPELKLIDITIKMYVHPVLQLDKAQLIEVRAEDIKRKQDLLAQLGVPKTHLTSKDKFAALLREAGCEPPTKISLKQSESAGYEVEVFAMSKQDQLFKDLLGHKNKRVRNLVEARFAVSSNALEKRCDLLIGRAHLKAQPVYLNYAGAKTLRWSGGDDANWQNLSSKRKVGGERLRASVAPPKGMVLLIADLSQIEARINSWTAGQWDVVEAFRAYDDGSGPDIYKYVAATSIYNKPVDSITPAERFIGKSCELALGYQAGWPRFAAMLRIGVLGPPVDISDSLARDVHQAWRNSRPYIVANWRATNNKVKSAFNGKQRIEDGVVAYEGVGDTGWMHLPGNTAIRYDGLQTDEDGMSYISKYRYNKVKPPTIKRTRLYGGILVENRTQALARRVIADHMLQLTDYLGPTTQIVLSTHDEIVMAVPRRLAQKALKAAKVIMSRSPWWAPGLPIAVDAHISERYDK